MCSEPIRYVFTVFHPQWGTVDVGTNCCDRMTGTQDASEQRRYAERLDRFLRSPKWVRPCRGPGWHPRDLGCHIALHGFAVRIYPVGRDFRIAINGRSGARRFASEDSAKRHAFHVIHSGEAHRFFSKEGASIQ